MIGVLLLALAFPPQPGSAPEPAEPLPREEKTGPKDWLAKFPGPQEGFMLRLQSLCTGEAYAGRVVSDDPEDEDMRAQRLIMGPARCALTDGRLASIAIPFAVGDDTSRTWMISRTASGLKLRHRHTLPDGSEDPVSRYGGVAEGGGTFTIQAFPTDAETRALFEREGLPQSSPNVWTLSIVPGDAFAYAMERPGRAFRAEFDLMRPVDARGRQAARASTDPGGTE